MGDKITIITHKLESEMRDVRKKEIVESISASLMSLIATSPVSYLSYRPFI